MGYQWLTGPGLLLGNRLRETRLSRRQHRRSIGRAGEQQHAVLGVISATTGGVVVGMAARLIAATVIADRIQHRETDSHPGEEQDGEKTKQSGRQAEPVTHGEHYHWYGAGKSMFLIRVGRLVYRGEWQELRFKVKPRRCPGILQTPKYLNDKPL